MLGIITRNKILIAVLALLVGAGAWYGLRGGSVPTELLATQDFTTSSGESDRDLVATLLQLRSVSLEGSIFSDPAFQSLQDFGSNIVPEPVGRANPFAPLQFGGGATTSPPLSPPKR